MRVALSRGIDARRVRDITGKVLVDAQQLRWKKEEEILFQNLRTA
jgi:hypothetical protein